MITTHVMGGFGNQLFQIFNLISYCLTNKIPFYFEYKEVPDRSDRPFYWDNFLFSLKPFVKKNYNRNMSIYRETGFHYTKITEYSQINNPFKFFGYFQSYKYFEEKKDDIFRFIKLQNQKQTIKDKYKDSYHFDNTISLHFRIGDYKNIQEHHPIIDSEYYISALKYIIKKTKKDSWNILYFYEEQDVTQVNSNINEIKSSFPNNNLNFIPVNTNIQDYEQVILMSLCMHNIIANSSFSWWGAYFNSNSDKIVCYPNPDKWFGPAQGNKNMNDMFPTTWINVSKIINENVFDINKKYSMLILSNSFHSKNKSGLEKMLSDLGWKYKYGNINEIDSFDIIFSPCHPVDTSQYPTKIFIFGPHFSVFPNTNILSRINNINNNSIYIQPSDWVVNLWKNMNANKIIPIKTLPFPVDMDRFNISDKIDKKERNKVFIYYKRRNPQELSFLESFLQNKNITYTIFNYTQGYKEENYLQFLSESKYGIILDAHESQGFAIEEALSCDVPLLVWNTKLMTQEYGGNYSNIPCTTIPYWDNRCGEFFYESKDFEIKYNEFINKLDMYKPRQFILETLSNENCSINLINLIKAIIF